MGYCTPEEVIARMARSDQTSPAFQQNVEDAIAAATTQIDEDTHRTFAASAEDVARYFGSPRGLVVLSVPDLISVTSIKLDLDDDGTHEYELTEADYELDTFTSTPGWPFEMVRLLTRTWPVTERRRVVEIVGSWGWTAVPAPINQACSILAARLAQRMSAAPFGVQPFGDLGGSPIRSNDPDYERLIAAYKRTGIA